MLQEKLTSINEYEAFRKVQDEIIKGVIHSILVMLDGGDALANKMNHDLIDENSKVSLKDDIADNSEIEYVQD